MPNTLEIVFVLTESVRSTAEVLRQHVVLGFFNHLNYLRIVLFGENVCFYA